MVGLTALGALIGEFVRTGADVGKSVGSSDSVMDFGGEKGAADRALVLDCEGSDDGAGVDMTMAANDGAAEVAMVGADVSIADGDAVDGDAVEIIDGAPEGRMDGAALGLSVGA